LEAADIIQIAISTGFIIPLYFSLRQAKQKNGLAAQTGYYSLFFLIWGFISGFSFSDLELPFQKDILYSCLLILTILSSAFFLDISRRFVRTRPSPPPAMVNLHPIHGGSGFRIFGFVVDLRP